MEQLGLHSSFVKVLGDFCVVGQSNVLSPLQEDLVGKDAVKVISNIRDTSDFNASKSSPHCRIEAGIPPKKAR